MQEIRERLHHPWAPFYVDYKACKRRIARCLRSRNAAIISDATASSSSEADLLEVADPEAYFFFEFDRQLEKATRFYAAKAAALAARTKALQYRVLHLLPLTKGAAVGTPSSRGGAVQWHPFASASGLAKPVGVSGGCVMAWPGQRAR